MFIIGLGTAAPPQRHPQQDGWDAVQKWRLTEQSGFSHLFIAKKVN
jgi:hypothetical protein